MPRLFAESPELNRRLASIIANAAAEIAMAVRQNIADEVTRLVGDAAGAPAQRIGARKRRVILCPVRGCSRPGGGPKWGWFCGEHKDLPAAEKARARARRRGKQN